MQEALLHFGGACKTWEMDEHLVQPLLLMDWTRLRTSKHTWQTHTASTHRKHAQGANTGSEHTQQTYTVNTHSKQGKMLSIEQTHWASTRRGTAQCSALHLMTRCLEQSFSGRLSHLSRLWFAISTSVFWSQICHFHFLICASLISLAKFFWPREPRASYWCC